MRRLARHLFTLCSAVSLLLFIAVCVLWIRNRDYVQFENPTHYSPTGWRQISLDEGAFYYTRIALVPNPDGSGTIEIVSDYRLLCWLVAAAFAALPAMKGVSLLRARRNHAPGLCPGCGYDLRASPDRCPECGREANARCGGGAA